MKKQTLLLLPILLVMSLSACNTNKGKDSSKESQTSSETPTSSEEKSSEPAKIQYTITFKDESGNVLQSQKWDEGVIPSYTYDKPDTEEWDYTFLGWSLTLGGDVIEIPAVSADATYFAIISKEKKSYTIGFYKETGEEIKTETLVYNTQPTCDYTGPEDTEEWDYTFLGWSLSLGGEVVEVVPAHENVNYYASVSKEKKTYTISFYKEDGTTAQSGLLAYGEQPSCDYTGPQDTAEWDYTFLGWSLTQGGEVISSIPTVTGNASYYARVSKELKSYTISFYKENGDEIKSETLGYGSQPSCDYTGPSDTDEWDYTFLGWATSQYGDALESIPTVTGNAKYYAKVEQIKKTYSIRFMENSGSLLLESVVPYGEVPEYDYEPTSTKEWKRTFLGWATTPNGEPLPELPPVTGNADYYAQVKEEKNKYTITFNSQGGSEVASITEDYGTSVNKPDNPSMDGYKFVAWTFDEEGEQKVTWPYTITDNVILYAQWNEKIDVKAYFQTLINALSSNPYGYVPDTMKPDYAGNIREESDLNKDYTESQDVSQIAFGGHGEQWNMALTNIKQSETFYDVLSVGSEVIALGTLAVNNWLDTEPSDVSSHEFDETEYKAKITYQNKVLKYTIQFKTGWSIPVVGDILPQIDMSYDIATGVKIFRIQLNNDNAMKYVVNDNYYAFGMNLAIEIAGKIGSRKAYFEISKDEETEDVTGHIYEFLTYQKDESSEEKVLLPACADFYFSEDYISVVGNKASGLVLFDGFITELYDATSGRLLVYKVEETFEKWGFSKTYNTLFFNLNNIDNINYVKAIDNGSSDPHENNHDVYVNNKDSIFVATKNVWKKGIIEIKTSRRYDIEMRKQYFYTLDEQDKPVKHEVLTPMMFIQDDGTEPGETNFSTFEADILTDNLINGRVNLDYDHLTKVRQDYLNLIPVFKENKDKQDSDSIIEFIGDAEVI